MSLLVLCKRVKIFECAFPIKISDTCQNVTLVVFYSNSYNVAKQSYLHLIRNKLADYIPKLSIKRKMANLSILSV